MKKIAFIINPISGKRKKKDIPRLIQQRMDKNVFSITIAFTEYVGHATVLARRFVEENYYAVVAVGGDGTVNEVAAGVRDTQTALGIVPMGSGNGFARFVGIPTQITKAIELLNSTMPTYIDYGLVNEIPFFATIGIGFDAAVARDFVETNRGLWNYIRTVIKCFRNYQTQKYQVLASNINVNTTAFLISVANIGEWGNGACIAPKADYKDALLDVVMVDKLSLSDALRFAVHLFTKRMDKNKHARIIKTKELMIRSENAAILIHVDGTPITLEKDLMIKIVHKGLKVLA